MHKTRIAVIGLKGLPAHGGAATVGEKIIDELGQRYEFVIYSTAANTRQNSYNGHVQVIIPRFGKGGLNTLMYYILSAFHALLLGKFKVIHLHHYSSGFIAPLLKLRFKVLSTFHGIPRMDDPKFGKLTNLFLRKNLVWNMRSCSTIVSVSRPDMEELKERFPSWSEKIIFIPNGMETLEVEAEEKMDDLIFAAGRIYDIKGLHLVLDAMHLMHHPPRLTVIGNLDHSSSYKERIINASRGLDVKFIGLLTDKQELYRQIKKHSCFLFPSLTEAMSMMLLEVASLKVPIIASDIPANQAVFDHTEVSFFRSGNAEDLKVVLARHLSDPKTGGQKAEAAFAKLKQNHDWETIAKSYADLYADVQE